MMKNRLILLLLSSTLIFGSCVYKKDYGNEDQSPIVAMAMHNAVVGQLGYALDPFNVAFRLNTLMVEADKKGVTVDAPEVATERMSLFGGASIVVGAIPGSYEITYMGAQPAKDYLHTGSIKINTNGTRLVNGNTWNVSVTPEMNYTVSVSSTIAKLYADSYEVTSDQDNSWNVIVRNCKTEISGTATKGNWYGSFVVKQNESMGDQSIAAISKSTYSVSISAEEVVASMGLQDTMSVTTSKDISFNPACPKNTIIVGTGKMTSSLSKDPNPMAFTVSEWKGTALTDCNPQITAIFYGNTIIGQ